MTDGADFACSSSMPLPEVRLSVQQLFNFFRIEGKENGILEFARRVGVERGSIYRWQRDGMELRTAEKISERTGVHPAAIWGPEYHIAVYMEEIRQEILAERKRQKMRIKRSTEKETTDAAHA